MAYFSRRIEATDTYKSLTPMQKEITMRRLNRGIIEHGYNVAKFKGFKRWKSETKYSPINFNIIKELYDKDEKEKREMNKKSA